MRSYVPMKGMLLNDEQYRVLKTLSEATSRMDFGLFAEKVNLTPEQTMHQVQELIKKGFLQRVGAGIGITQNGKAVLKAFLPVEENTGFRFYYGVDKPSGLTAQSLQEFYGYVKIITVESLEFHLYRGDFANWLRDVCKDDELASRFDNVKSASLKGEQLRKNLLKALDAKYSIEELL